MEARPTLVKEKVRQEDWGKQWQLSLRNPNIPQPLPPHNLPWLFAAWAVGVATAGQPEVTDETVIWPDEEPVRSPIQEWSRPIKAT